MALDPAKLFSTPLAQSEQRVWVPGDSDGLGYPSDDFARGPLLTIVESADDLTSLSPELEAEARSWPARYYLSAERSTLLRAFTWDRTASVMEVGSGCGSITRLLGETFGSVVGVEGEMHRAVVGASRSRDQDNVAVVCAPFQSLVPHTPFDIIFSIGVLEYSPMYSQAADPIAEMLGNLRARVADDGVVVIAIENKMGLKYFSGSAEDHTGLRYDGIEGYRRSGARGPRTLGREELRRSLAAAGFESVEFFYPFPDYKFATALIADSALEAGGEQLAELAAKQVATDYRPYPRAPRFDQRAAWHEIARNGLVGDLANSFLVVASPTPGQTKVTAPWDARWFTFNPRLPAYWASAQVTGLGAADPIVVRERLSSTPQVSGGITMTEHSSEPWVNGQTVGEIALDVAMGNSSTCTDVAEALRPWADFLRHHADADDRLPASFLDATPFNVVVDEAGEPVYIDQEWSWHEPMKRSAVLVRGLVMLFVRARDTGALGSQLTKTPVATLVRDTAGLLGVDANRADLQEYVDVQGQVMRQIQGFTGSTATLLRSLALSSVTQDAAVGTAKAGDLARRAVGRARRIAQTRLGGLSGK